MPSVVEKALSRTRAVRNTAHQNALILREKGTLENALNLVPFTGASQLNQFSDQAANKQRYSLFRGWVHAAINALAMEGAGQPVCVGKIIGTRTGTALRPNSAKSWEIQKMTKQARDKAAKQELEILADHPLLTALESPNNVQDKFQFVYSFFANLCLTGWGYIVGGETEEGGFEFYSLPTTWIRPDHSKGLFQQFRIVNPKNPTASLDTPPLDRSQVAFAYLPNPSDPISALSLAQAQLRAIRIDDHIQSSQHIFFEQGMFPSMIITVGRDPHPEIAGGLGPRPRLTAAQRRQVHGAIRKISTGIANYGNPAIIDGYIENFERMSADSNEMGWEKSEKMVRTRILSAFGVHPFILGDESPASYAQADVVERRFCKRVNTFLDMLGTVMTTFAGPMSSIEKERLLVWWQECVPENPALRQKLWTDARKNGDISQNEFRAFMGLPPDEDRNQSHINRHSLKGVLEAAGKVTAGGITVDQGTAIFENLGLPDDEATRIAGTGPSEESAVQEATGIMQEAVEEMKKPIRIEASDLSGTLSESILAASKSILVASSTQKNVEDLDRKLDRLSLSLDTEKAERELNAKSVANSISIVSSQMESASEVALAKLTTVISTKQSQDDQSSMVKDVLKEMTKDISQSFNVIEEAIKQPIVVNVSNQVEPTPVNIDVGPTPVKVDVENFVNPAGVEVINRVETPEITIDVKTPSVNVESPTINVAAPDIDIKTPDVVVNPAIQIDVQPAKVDVNISKDKPPTRATITHPGGRQSQVELKD